MKEQERINLSLLEKRTITGGRLVIKEDLDGKWDLKTVITSNKIKVVYRDEDGRSVMKQKV